MPYPWEYNTRFPVLQQTAAFMAKVMVTPKATNSEQDQATAGNLHAAARQPDSDRTIASKQDMQF